MSGVYRFLWCVAAAAILAVGRIIANNLAAPYTWDDPVAEYALALAVLAAFLIPVLMALYIPINALRRRRQPPADSD